MNQSEPKFDFYINKLNKQWRQKKKDGYFTDETTFNLNAVCGERNQIANKSYDIAFSNALLKLETSK